MSLSIASLNSGSNGNCYYLENEDASILVDAGISCREIETRMQNLQLSPEKLKAVFISHEHRDHIKGLAVLHRKYSLPVYMSTPTRKAARLKLDKNLVFDISHETPVAIGSMLVTPFSKAHDAVDPYSFLVSNRGVHVGVFTDIGKTCGHLETYFKLCHAAFLESNYDDDMLESGNYPLYLKNRIRDGRGHLSNAEALQLLIDHRPAHMSHLLLSHLSKNNNDPKVAMDLFLPHCNKINLMVASRNEPSTLIHISDNGAAIPHPLAQQIPPTQLQLSL